MKLIFIRHGVAEDREVYFLKGIPDELRPLTEKGKKQLKKMVKWLKNIEPQIDQIWTSPLVRAQETTEVVKRDYPQAKIFEKKGLEPQNSPDILISGLNELPSDFKSGDSCVALVGHEPHLGQMVGSLIGEQSQRTPVTFKKAGMALINFSGSGQKGPHELKWLVTPKLLLKT